MDLLRWARRHDNRAAWLVRVLAVSRVEIRQGRFQRSIAIIATISAVVSGFEAYVQHDRGAFRHRLMWTPIWLMPLAVLAGIASIFNQQVVRRWLPVVSVVSLIDGIVGFLYHLRGINRLPGGFGLGRYNIVMGPPVFAPLLTCIVGTLGIIASGLRPERLDWLKRGFAPHGLSSNSNRSSRGGDLSWAVAHGRAQQLFAIVVAVFAVLAGGEAYFEHLRGSFNQRVMWTPIWLMPPMALATIGAAANREAARRALPLVSLVTMFDGMLGFILHLRGIARMPGGFANLRFNLTLGPPLFAPLLFSSVGLLGLIASLLRRRDARR
jgi:hypothetical protein